MSAVQIGDIAEGIPERVKSGEFAKPPVQTDALANLPDHTVTQRSKGVWRKLIQWYGGDKITKEFGAIPPREWCEAIDSIGTREALAKIMTEVRHKHVTFPPRFPEFEAIVNRFSRPLQTVDGPTVMEQLHDFVVRTKKLSRTQHLAASWNYLYRGFARSGHGLECVGVVIAADGDVPGFRVTVEDMRFAMATPVE